jgi:hypothetical protein
VAMQRRRMGAPGLTVHPDRPLVGVIMVEDGQEVTRYFADETDADMEVAQHAAGDARSLAGAWADLNWEEAIEEFDRIRHDNQPTPPIDAL